MSGIRASALAPFRVRGFRFQWPADMATSWAFEMETIILGWYVLVETRSVFLLTVFASLQHLGTLVAPMFGVIGDRIGHRNLLCCTRAVYVLCATTLMSCAYLDLVTPVLVLCIAAIMGTVRPSDIGTRSALVAETMPHAYLMGAMGIQRTTQDSARIAGALTGAGLVATLGMGVAYTVVVTFYAASILLTLKAGKAGRHEVSDVAPKRGRATPWRDLREGLAYVRRTPVLLAIMVLAFLLNLTTFPLMNGLMPYAAKEIYLTSQTGLGYMVAGASLGALLTSVAVGHFGQGMHAARLMVVGSAAWYLVLLLFSQLDHLAVGILVLFLAGASQSLSQVPMATMILRTSEPQYRGRVMGIRMLSVYGNIPGLLIAGPLIASVGYPFTAALYCVLGLLCTLWIAARWRADLWGAAPPAR